MSMDVRCFDFVAGAREARGIAVVIDVFRAFSVACYATDAGAVRIHPVADLDEARQLKREHPDWIAIGERHARRVPGFDLGNSPTDVVAAGLAGKTVIHTTHAGTQGLRAAAGADEVLTGSLVNAAALCRYLERRRPARVSLVRMGHEAVRRCDEDDLCAELLAARLAGGTFDTSIVRERLRHAPAAGKFFDPEADWAPETDFELCTAVDRFDFVLRLADRDSPLPWLERIPA